MYDVNKTGVVIAVRIFFKRGSFNPYAELVFAFGGSVIVNWANTEETKQYSEGINCYTLFYDERPKRAFSEWPQINH